MFHRFVVIDLLQNYSNCYYLSSPLKVIFTIPIMNDTNQIISAAILSKLKELKQTRKMLAELTKTDKIKLDNYLQCKAKWDVEYVKKIFYALDISFDNLLIPKKHNVSNIFEWDEILNQNLVAENIEKYKVNTTIHKTKLTK